MSKCWVYKCNSKGLKYQHAWGDWAGVFASPEAQGWGTTEFIPRLTQAHKGDTIIAFQTDRNELVGVARVQGWKARGKYKELILKPLETIGVRVRPLKAADPKVARIPAFMPGPIQTLYRITHADAHALLKAAGAHLIASDGNAEGARQTPKGAGFGTPEKNKQVELAALRCATRSLKTQGWAVRDVSSEKPGYDLLCKRSKKELHVEVKGARGEEQQFVLTARELDTWRSDGRSALVFVGRALTSKPLVSFFPHSAAQREFKFRPLSYVVSRRPNLMADGGARRAGT